MDQCIALTGECDVGDSLRGIAPEEEEIAGASGSAGISTPHATCCDASRGSGTAGREGGLHEPRAIRLPTGSRLPIRYGEPGNRSAARAPPEYQCGSDRRCPDGDLSRGEPPAPPIGSRTDRLDRHASRSGRRIDASPKFTVAPTTPPSASPRHASASSAPTSIEVARHASPLVPIADRVRTRRHSPSVASTSAVSPRTSWHTCWRGAWAVRTAA